MEFSPEISAREVFASGTSRPRSKTKSRNQSLVHFSEIDLLSMSFEEGQNAGFFDAVNVPPISVASTCALEPVTEPSVRVQIGQIRLLADARAERD